MLAKRLTMLFVVFPLIATLMSCAHETPPSPPSFSVQIRDTASEQKRADCDVLKPEAIPSISQQLIDTLPAKLDGETEYGYAARLTDQQTAIYEWFNSAVRNGKRWQVFCSA